MIGRRQAMALGIGALAAQALPLRAATAVLPAGIEFPSIEGGTLRMDDWRGRPVLVVNTASLCGFVGQFDDLQSLHEAYGARGLVVLAVPSDDFRQELEDAAAVKDFCTLNYDLTLPMTDILHVKGPKAHPFYRWMAEAHGFVPGWNFNKVLIGPAGEVAGTWGSMPKPTARAITGRIEALLGA